MGFFATFPAVELVVAVVLELEGTGFSDMLMISRSLRLPLYMSLGIHAYVYYLIIGVPLE